MQPHFSASFLKCRWHSNRTLPQIGRIVNLVNPVNRTANPEGWPQKGTKTAKEAGKAPYLFPDRSPNCCPISGFINSLLCDLCVLSWQFPRWFPRADFVRGFSDAAGFLFREAAEEIAQAH